MDGVGGGTSILSLIFFLFLEDRPEQPIHILSESISTEDCFYKKILVFYSVCKLGRFSRKKNRESTFPAPGAAAISRLKIRAVKPDRIRNDGRIPIYTPKKMNLVRHENRLNFFCVGHIKEEKVEPHLFPARSQFHRDNVPFGSLRQLLRAHRNGWYSIILYVVYTTKS